MEHLGNVNSSDENNVKSENKTENVNGAVIANVENVNFGEISEKKEGINTSTLDLSNLRIDYSLLNNVLVNVKKEDMKEEVSLDLSKLNLDFSNLNLNDVIIKSEKTVDVNNIDLSNLNLNGLRLGDVGVISETVEKKVDFNIIDWNSLNLNLNNVIPVDKRAPCMPSILDVSKLRVIEKCGYNLQTLCGNLECQGCYNRSFASYHKSQYWSSLNNINPRFITKSSSRSFIFNCDTCYHSFENKMASVSRKAWCPYCSIPVRKLCENIECLQCFDHSFSSVLCSKYLVNNDISSRQIIKGCSSLKYDFKCPDCNYISSNYPYAMRGAWNCIHCNGQSLCDRDDCVKCYESSFASCYRSKYWDVSNDKTPRQYFKGSSTYRVKFKCPDCDHVFENNLCIISQGAAWCPYCSSNGKALCENYDCSYCHSKSFASTENSKHIIDKNINPRHLPKFGIDRLCFLCHKCGHVFNMKISGVSSGHWCQFCAGKILCSSEWCKTCLNRSYLAQPDAFKWSKLNTTKPREVFRSAVQSYWFTCDICNHDYMKSLNSPSGCPFCSHHKLCDKDCDFCLMKSFASHYRSNRWSSENKKTARQVHLKSSKVYIFDCDNCSHQFLSTPAVISNGSWCPYCSYSCKKLCNSECNDCYIRSFESHPLSKYWSVHNKCKPRDVVKHSQFEYLHMCQYCGNEYRRKLASLRESSGCHDCLNKSETRLFKILYQSFEETQREAKFEWCKSTEYNRYYYFDFLIESCKILIELDGMQHFEKTFPNDHVDVRRYRDTVKMVAALAHGYTIIRVNQDEFYEGKLNIEETVIKNIKLYDKPSIIFVSNDKNIYKMHHDELSEYIDIDNINIDYL